MRKRDRLSRAVSSLEILESRRMLCVDHQGNMMPAPETPDNATPFAGFNLEQSAREGSSVVEILIIRAAWADSPTSDPQSAASVTSMMQSVADYMQENSYGKISISFAVTDLIVLPGTQADYTAAGIETVLADARAKAAAENPNWNYLNYDLEAVRYAGGPGNFGGAAYVGARGCWLKSSSAGVAAHEFGHNFGLYHANYWDPTADETIVGPGANVEYGDSYDTMGSANAGAYHFNAYEKNLLRWLPTANVATATTGGVYRIFAHDSGVLEAENDYAIKFKRDNARDYWVEFRQHAGFSGNQWLMNGVTVRWDPWANSANGSHLLDTTPFTPDGKNDAGLVLGQSWTDPVYGMTITPLAKINGAVNAMDVKISFNKSANAPTGDFNASSLTVAPGQTVNFSATASDADGDTLAYHWDFGDKTFGNNSAAASKSWSTAGKYRVRLTISDTTGNTFSKSVIVTVGTAPTNRFTVAGKVLDRNNSPVAGILVHNGLAPTAANYRFTFTDSDGTYTLTNLVSGSYTLTAIRGGFVSTAGFTNPLSVTTNRTAIDFSTKQTTYKITGRVSDIGGAGVPGALVTNGIFTEPTDINGNYTLPGVPLGAYPITATKVGYNLVRPLSTPAVVDFGDVGSVNVLETGAEVTGQIVGVPAGRLVDVTTGISTLSYLSQGNPLFFTLNLPQGLAYLRAEGTDATYSSSFTNPLNVSGPITGLVLTYGAESTFAISGKITDLGNGLGGATVTLSPGGHAVQTDARGNYYMDGLAAGEYTLAVAKDGVAFAESSRQVTIIDAGLTAQDFTSTTVNQAPTFAQPAFATPAATNLNSVALGVLGADDQGETTLRYDWSVVLTPAGGTATFELDNFNSAKNTFVTFNNVVGNYTLRVTARDLYGATVTSDVVVTIDRTAPLLAGSPNFAFETSQTANFGFNENVGASLSSADFSVQNLGTGQFVDSALFNVSFNPVGNIGSLNFAGNALPDGNYRATLLQGGVTDAAGNVLAAGSQVDFYVFAGDATRDRSVGINDFAALAANFNTAGTFSQGNFNYDSTVNIADFAILAAKFNTSLAAPGDLPRAGLGLSRLFATQAIEENELSDLLA